MGSLFLLSMRLIYNFWQVMNTRTFHHEARALLVCFNHSPNVSTNKCSCVIRTSIGFFRTQNHKMAERISDRKFLDADPFEVKLRDKFFGGVRNIKNSRDTISSALKQKPEIGTRNEWTTVKGPQTQYFLCLYFLLGSRNSKTTICPSAATR